MRENTQFRLWFYFRMGWSTYFAFIFAAINTLVVTYFLAIDKVPILNDIFPSFLHYVLTLSSILIPFLVLIGWLHYRKTAAYGSEAEVQVETNPYIYKLPPGWNREALFPTLLKMTEFMIKSNNNEKLDDESIKELVEINKKLDTLVKGGIVGKNTKK
jgi:hypothetical protein